MTNPTAPRDLERYWASLPRLRGVPLRRDLDPAAMEGLLEDCFILERVAPGVARFRIAGRNLHRLLGVEPRGLPLTAAFLPEARAAMAQHLDAAFTTPGLVELSLEGPRAVAQPRLTGKILLLPLRDDHGQISRLLGLLVMSGRRGLGGRRFTISQTEHARFEPIPGLHPVSTPEMGPKDGLTGPSHQTIAHRRPARAADSNKAEDRPALRLVVSNS
ncbi:PAS domain-containing protein [Thalassorhabdomicrobium marinisediminis]|uniref:PAS domain-containing protein n=1 Tax=Thalassorhabdomicrobium marinisediminis TaxID=2170577 RepID=UPI0024923BEB|nr:PAS domain-containing protein [Thalassorhabdomicrobium marinisediminis]